MENKQRHVHIHTHYVKHLNAQLSHATNLSIRIYGHIKSKDGGELRNLFFVHYVRSHDILLVDGSDADVTHWNRDGLATVWRTYSGVINKEYYYLLLPTRFDTSTSGSCRCKS